MKRPVCGIRGFAGLLALTTLVSIEKPALAGNARVHDGLYLRAGVGIGYGIDAVSSDPIAVGVAPFVFTTKIEGTATGFAGASELAAGWSLSDGFVLGGGLYSVWIFSPTAKDVTLTAGGVSVSTDVDFDASSLHVLGPFVDYYLNPEQGFHLQGGLGFAWLSAGDSHYRANGVDVAVQSTGGSGFGLMLGAGDEWWISDDFSIGVLGRLTAGFMSGERNNVTWNHTAWGPAVLFVATMN